MKIATHNSATGERGYGLLSFLVTPFSKCQSKTIYEQYKSGCRYFDIRIRKVNGIYYCAHGKWRSKRTLDSILEQINIYGDCYVMLTYEGKYIQGLARDIEVISSTYKNIKFTTFNVKKPVWYTIGFDEKISHRNGYKVLDGRSWHTYLPIPWLWKKIYYNKPVFSDNVFTMVDYL